MRASLAIASRMLRPLLHTTWMRICIGRLRVRWFDPKPGGRRARRFQCLDTRRRSMARCAPRRDERSWFVAMHERSISAGVPIRKAGYLPYIDGLRAVAVLSVVAYHLDARWLPGGFTGVDMFFA